jgi:hypothetical protein
MSFPLFSGLLASSMAATVFAPDDIPTCQIGDQFSNSSM